MAINKRLKHVLWVIGGTLGALVLIPIVAVIIIAIVVPSSTEPRAAATSHPTKTIDHPRKTIPHHAAVAPAKRPQPHEAKIVSYAFVVEPGDPPGTLTKLKLAAHLAAKSKNCVEVIDAFYVAPKDRFSGHKDQPYFVRCETKHGPYGVYFTDSDLKAGHVKNQQQPISKDRAILLCEAAIKGQLRYSSSFELSDFSGGGVSNNGTTNREVMLPFTALNGLGNRIPQWGKCIVGPTGQTEVTLLNR